MLFSLSFIVILPLYARIGDIFAAGGYSLPIIVALFILGSDLC